MEKTITKDILRDQLFAGGRPPAELLYNRYGGMLFSYILQFVPSRTEAEQLLVKIFSTLASRLDSAFDSSLSVYCWLQVEARKIILEHRKHSEHSAVNVFPREAGAPLRPGAGNTKAHYFSLLDDATQEQRWVFRELFINGRQREELAVELNKDQGYIADTLKECMQIIRKKLG